MNHQQAIIRQQAYREAVRKAGSVAKLSKKTKVSESKITYRMNNPYADTNYRDDLVISYIYSISIRRLCPDQPKLNDIVEKGLSSSILDAEKVSLEKIKLIKPSPRYYRTDLPDLTMGNAIVVDHLYYLISGYHQFQQAQLKGKIHVPVIMIDTSALLLNTSLSSLYVHAMIIEKAAIGLYLESLLCRRGIHGRSVDKTNAVCSKKMINHLSTDESPQVLQDFAKVQAIATANLSGQSTRNFLAKQLGFGNHESYRQACKILLIGNASLIHAVNKENVPLYTAVKLMKLSPLEQTHMIEQSNDTNNMMPIQIM